MTKTYISEFKEGLAIESVFLCNHKALLKDKNGKPYLNVQLMDRTGLVEGRIWDKAPQFSQSFNKLDYVRIKGNLVSFQGHLQLNIRDIGCVSDTEIQIDDFLPHTQKDIETMYQELLTLCREELKNVWVQKLVLSILEDPQLAPSFKRAPAAKSNHHAWIGGLLEHVLQLCKIGRDTLQHYPMINPDLVLAGLILHDFGKVEELSAERSFAYTDKGQLVGHLIIGVEILIRKANAIPEFPVKILHHLEHIILSHHGLLEYGSPKEPMTLEALMVHHLDNMDSKLQGFQDSIARETDGDPTWSAPAFLFKRPLYKCTAEDMGTKSKTLPANTGPRNEGKLQTSQNKKPANPPKRPHSKEPLKTNLGALLSEQLKQK